MTDVTLAAVSVLLALGALITSVRVTRLQYRVNELERKGKRDA